MTLTARRPRTRPNSTAPATSANSVSSSPRPTPLPGWKCVPRCRTMISPAFTCWPPNRFTPSRCALESRPLRLDDAPFLCAICYALLRLRDAGDPDLRVLLPVPLTALVARLVPVVNHVDLRPCGRTYDLSGHLVTGELCGVADDGAVVHHEQRGERDARPGFAFQLVDGEHVIKGDLLLPAAAAHNRVHPRTASPCERAPDVAPSTCVATRDGLAMNLDMPSYVHETTTDYLLPGFQPTATGS